MNDLLNQSFTGYWWVCETSDRWTNAAKRFCDDMMPQNVVAAIETLGPDQISSRSLISTIQISCRNSIQDSAYNAPGLVIWDLDSLGPVAALKSVIPEQIRLSRQLSDPMLQIAVLRTASIETQLTLAQLGIDVFVRHPEDLARWAPLIKGHFARATGNLD